MTLRFSPPPKGTDTAFLFPGQGTQSVGMGEGLYNNSPAARAVFHEVDMALSRPLTRLLFEGPDDTLRQTVNAQPAIMTVSLATMRAIQDYLGAEATPRPALVAGHSLGEYTALAVAGVLDIGETAWLVQERGRLMQEACEKQSGSMAAVMGLDAMVLEQICRETGTVISTVNTPDQIVIAGERRALANALDLANARGAKKAVPLRVAGAFHSPLMEPAQAGLIDAVESLNFKDPSNPHRRQLYGQAGDQGRGRQARAHRRNMQLRPLEPLGRLHDGHRREPLHRGRPRPRAQRHGQAHQPPRRRAGRRRLGLDRQAQPQLISPTPPQCPPTPPR